MTSYSQPDTIYLAINLDWNEDVLATLTKLKRKVVNHRKGDIGRFLNAMYEADSETSLRMRNMSISEAQDWVSERDEEVIEFERIGTTFGGYDWECYGWSPRKGCPLTFENRKFKLHVMPKNNRETPNLYIELGQVALWSHNWRALLEEAKKLPYRLGSNVEIKLSRLDVATHTQEILEEDLNHEKFKTRLTKNRSYKKNELKSEIQDLVNAIELETDKDKKTELFSELYKASDRIGESDRTVYKTGFRTNAISFGIRGSKNPFVRLYLKDREISYTPTKKKLFHDVWDQLGFDYKNKSVMNIEFEMLRECLRKKQFTIIKDSGSVSFMMETIDDLLANFDHLLCYLMGPKGCIRMISESKKDSNRSRWNTDPRWLGLVAGLKDVTEAKITIKKIPYRRDDRMDKTLLSYMVNFWASIREGKQEPVPLSLSLISIMHRTMTESCLKEIKRISNSAKYCSYIRNKMERELRKRNIAI